MLTYHQCGHNTTWNVESLRDDGAGHGLIISPVNLDADKITARIPQDILEVSWIDPQFYLPDDSKGKLSTYPFFPANVIPDFTTTDFEIYAADVARECLAFQSGLGLKYLVIPTRYYDHLPEDHLDQLTALFVEPFLSAREELGLELPILLTVVAKPPHLEPGPPRTSLLSWATGFEELSGVYLIFDSNFYSKQIKDPAYLVAQLRFITALRRNDLEVHVGYAGLEGLLMSVADATSVSMGSYENLRSFGIQRLATREPTVQRGPRARVYSGLLLQSIEDTFLAPLRELTPDWMDLFDDSPYKEFLLDPESALSFQRPEVYKHYFHVYARQIAAVPALGNRATHLRSLLIGALQRFDRIRDSGVFLDGDSDQSHLPGWLNALAMYTRQPE